MGWYQTGGGGEEERSGRHPCTPDFFASNPTQIDIRASVVYCVHRDSLLTSTQIFGSEYSNPTRLQCRMIKSPMFCAHAAPESLNSGGDL